jgi:hypothetical protein
LQWWQKRGDARPYQRRKACRADRRRCQIVNTSLKMATLSNKHLLHFLICLCDLVRRTCGRGIYCADHRTVMFAGRALKHAASVTPPAQHGGLIYRFAIAPRSKPRQIVRRKMSKLSKHVPCIRLSKFASWAHLSTGHIFSALSWNRLA